MKRISHVSVGINDYPAAPLNGCRNDALDWDAALTGRGSTGTVLLDADATKENILDAIRGALTVAHRGDTVIGTFSTHGTWIPDLDGDEADHRDEALVPYDYTDGHLIVDDDIHALAEARPFGVRFLLVTDACHSGTVSRFAGLQPEPIDGTTGSRPRFLNPEFVLPTDQLPAARRAEKAAAKGTPRASAALFAACQDDQVAWDCYFGARPNGAFTRAALDSLAADEPANLTDWLHATRGRIQAQQTPQIAGSWWQRHRARFI